MAAVGFKFIRPPGLSQTQWNVLSGQALKVTRSKTPFDTTRLRESWDATITRRSVTLKTDETSSEYASFVQNGESPHPHLSARQEANKGFVDRAELNLKQLGDLIKGRS